jgi:hypothetical protein
MNPWLRGLVRYSVPSPRKKRGDSGFQKKREKPGRFARLFRRCEVMRLHHQSQTFKFLVQGFHVTAIAFDAARGVQRSFR